MNRFTLLATVSISSFSIVAAAQTQQTYTGLQARNIKALSEQQIADLKAGKGMSLALAAELNGYPGPSHVLELADQLDLSTGQRMRVQQLFADMKSEASALGEQLISDEGELDALFATRSATSESLANAANVIGRRQAALRVAHLRYHLITRDLLSEAQVVRYAELRGYAGNARQGHSHNHDNKN